MPQSTTQQRQRALGFTLIEVMIVVAIIGILGAIGYPSYTQYLVKSHRSAAQLHLIDLARAEAQYMADSRSYTDSMDELGMTTPDAVSAKYKIEIALTAGPPSSFTITATPVIGGSQAKDGALTINSAGTRTPAAKW